MSEVHDHSRRTRTGSPNRGPVGPRRRRRLRHRDRRARQSRAARCAIAASTSRTWSAPSPTSRSGACWWTATSSPACHPPNRTRSPCARAITASTCSRRSRCSRPSGALAQLIDISDEQARDNLARASVMALSFVAQSAREAGQPPVPQTEVDQGRIDPRALPDPLARRGQPRPRQGDRRLLDLRRRARHERLDVHRAGGRLDRRRLRRGAVRRGRRALGAAARRRARRAC